MKSVNRFLAVVLIILLAVLFLYRNAKEEDSQDKIEPATVEEIAGSELKRVKLTAEAAERLGIETEAVRWAQGGPSRAARTVVPYSAIIYDLSGETWVYTSPEPLSFVRHKVVVDVIEADQAYLLDGPAVETEVVTVGVAELYGAETGVGK